MKLSFKQTMDWGEQELLIEKLLSAESSSYQHIAIVKTHFFGQALLLDNELIMTESDAEVLHEYSVHIPLFSHPNPEHVVICGAGWGGCIPQALKHANVQTILQCEKDDVLTDLAIHFFPDFGLDIINEKSQLLVMDTLELSHSQKNTKDILIIDWNSITTEQKQPEKQVPIFQSLLNPQGILMLSVGSIYKDATLIQRFYQILKSHFVKVYPLWAHMPSVLGGVNLWFFCSNEVEPVLNTAQRGVIQQFNHQMTHYNAANHDAAFLLPNLVRKIISPTKEHFCTS